MSSIRSGTEKSPATEQESATVPEGESLDVAESIPKKALKRKRTA